MKIKKYTEFINESNDNGNNWKERTLDLPLSEFFKRFFIDKKKIDEDDNYITYEHYDKQYDEEENEFFWEKKKIIKVDKSRTDITHYFEKTIIDRPLYKTRDDRMTREQELTTRTWCGTSIKPKSGIYKGYDKGLAKFKSDSGRLYHVLPNGDIIEMLNPDKIDDEYIESIVDYLLDTKNLDLIDIVKNQANIIN